MGSRGSNFTEDESNKLLANIQELETELSKEEAIHEQNRQKNGRGWYESMVKAKDPNKIRITRGSKEKGNYEVKEVSPEELEDYVDVIKPMKISGEKIVSAYKQVKDVLNQKEYKPTAGYTDNLRLLGIAVNRYKGLDFVNLFNLSYGSGYSTSEGAKNEIRKIEKALGVKLLK